MYNFCTNIVKNRSRSNFCKILIISKLYDYNNELPPVLAKALFNYILNPPAKAGGNSQEANCHS
jgi:hypothetical protein